MRPLLQCRTQGQLWMTLEKIKLGNYLHNVVALHIFDTPKEMLICLYLIEKQFQRHCAAQIHRAVARSIFNVFQNFRAS